MENLTENVGAASNWLLNFFYFHFAHFTFQKIAIFLFIEGTSVLSENVFLAMEVISDFDGLPS